MTSECPGIIDQTVVGSSHKPHDRGLFQNLRNKRILEEKKNLRKRKWELDQEPGGDHGEVVEARPSGQSNVPLFSDKR